MRPIVVYDTNILFSGIGWRGTPYRCLELAQKNRVDGLTCPEILDELAEKLTTKLNFSLSQIADAITDLLGFLRVVEISNMLNVVEPDSDDDKVIECAVVGEADYVITGDWRHLLPIGSYRGILIVTATDFLAKFDI